VTKAAVVEVDRANLPMIEKIILLVQIRVDEAKVF
jgi:hypothetical protein